MVAAYSPALVNQGSWTIAAGGSLTQTSGNFFQKGGTLTTNGTTMVEKRIERIIASGVQVVDVSIDALTPETYAKVRVGGDLNVTRAR